LWVKKRTWSRLHRSGYAEAERVEPNTDISLDTDSRTDDVALVAPGTAADDPIAWIPSLEPSCPVRRGAVITFMPTIPNPLPDVPVHVVKPKPVGFKRSNRRRLLKVPLAATAVAIGAAHTRSLPHEYRVLGS